MACSLHGQWRGDPINPPLLFLHGYLGAGDEWSEIIEGLKDVFYCGVVDLPGHGSSTGSDDLSDYSFPGAASALKQFLLNHNISSTNWYGYSLGGRLALYMAVQHPEWCRRVIVESSSPGLLDPAQAIARLKQDEAWARRFEQEPLTDVLRDWYRQPIFASLHERPETFERMLKRRLQNDPRQMARVMRGFSVGAQRPLWEALSGLSTPLLVLAGRKDRKYREVARRMKLQENRIEVRDIADAGHNVHLEQPAQVTKVCREWFAN